MNAKTEILEHIDNRDVEFVRVKIVHYAEKGKTFEGKLDDILQLIDFDYDDGYGSQYLDGVIWYADGTWSDRREYDGSEWWEHQVRPSLSNTEKYHGAKRSCISSLGSQPTTLKRKIT